jgi:hypothetical protein
VFKGFFGGGGGRGGVKKRLCNVPLVLGGEPDNLGSLNGQESGFTCRRHDKIREGAPFDFRGTLKECMNVARQTRLQSSGGLTCLFRHNPNGAAKCRTSQAAHRRAAIPCFGYGLMPIDGQISGA